MQAYLFDIIIVLILAFFAWRGAKKGLILTLCSLVGIFIAFFGARWTSAKFYEPVADIIEPPIYQAILGVTEENTEQAAFSIGNTALANATYTLDELLELLEESELFIGFSEFLEEAAEKNAIPDQADGSAARALAAYLAPLIAKAALFSIAFLLILLIWFLLGHILDLAFKLPVLSTLNWLGGLLLGLLKAVLLVMVLIWIGQRAGLIPNPPETPVVTLFTVEKVLSLLNGLIA